MWSNEQIGIDQEGESQLQEDNDVVVGQDVSEMEQSGTIEKQTNGFSKQGDAPAVEEDDGLCGASFVEQEAETTVRSNPAQMQTDQDVNVNSLEIEIKPERVNIDSDGVGMDYDAGKSMHFISTSEELRPAVEQKEVSKQYSNLTVPASPNGSISDQSDHALSVPSSMLSLMETELQQKLTTGGTSGLASGSNSHSESFSQEEDPAMSMAVLGLRELCRDITTVLALVDTAPPPEGAAKLRETAVSARRKINVVLNGLLGGEDEEWPSGEKRVTSETTEPDPSMESRSKPNGEVAGLRSPLGRRANSTKQGSTKNSSLSETGKYVETPDCEENEGNLDTTEVWSNGNASKSDDDANPVDKNERDRKALLMGLSDDSDDDVSTVPASDGGADSDRASPPNCGVTDSDDTVRREVRSSPLKAGSASEDSGQPIRGIRKTSNKRSGSVSERSDEEDNPRAKTSNQQPESDMGSSGDDAKPGPEVINKRTKSGSEPFGDGIKPDTKLSDRRVVSESQDSDASEKPGAKASPRWSESDLEDSDDTLKHRNRKHLHRGATKQGRIAAGDEGDGRSRTRKRRLRRPAGGPPEPTDTCSVSLVRLPEKLERDAAVNGFVAISRRAKQRLCEQELHVRRLANIAIILRSSTGKKYVEDSDDSQTDDTDDSRRCRPTRKTSGKRPTRAARRRVKDMSSGGEESGSGSEAAAGSEGAAEPGPSALLPQEQNDFDRLQLLASDSSDGQKSEKSPSSEDDDDSDFVPEKKGKQRRERDKDMDIDSPDDDKTKGKNKTKRKSDKSDDDNDRGKESDSKSKGKSETNSSNESEADSNKARDQKDKSKKASDSERDNDKADSEGEEKDSVNGEAKTKKKGVEGSVKKLLSCKLSATDSSEEDEKEMEKLRAKKETTEKTASEENGEGSTDEDESDAPVAPAETVDIDSSDDEAVKKKRSPKKRRIQVASDSDVEVLSESEEAAEASKKRSHSTTSISSTSDGSSDDFAAPKKTRSRKRLKRVRKMSDDSASTSGSDGGNDDSKSASQGTPGKSGRKNIRHIRAAEVTTKQASQAEQARRKRIEEKQSQYNELFEKEAQVDEAPTKLVLDFDKETKKSLVSVHKNFVKILKPHQVDGVKFMFDATIETVERLEEEKNADSAGCILAHCMGLGKTLQVVVLLHTLLTSSETRQKMACGLVVCPKNTVANWVRELRTWQKKCRVPEVDVVDITFKKDNYERSFELQEWTREGGVCVLSYDMFKRLTGTGGKKGYNKKQMDRFQQALVDPGPDIVVCDEGHLLKNPRTAAFKSLNQMKCSRRVILTGTPLQNNLREYHTMVEFVKPRLLGSETEFSNRFIRPIENGSAVDAQPRDVKLMKRRSHVLHKLLDAVVQRRDYNVLTPFLPPKHEYTVLVMLSDVQKRLYGAYLDRASRATTRRILSDFQALARVWSHPRCVQMKDEQDDEANELKQEKLAMAKFVAGDSETSSEEDASNNATPNGGGSPAAEDKPEEEEWWRSCLPEDCDLDATSLSGKLSLLDELLIKCENIGDKLLVFSQSLFSLNLIEEHLARLHKGMQKKRNSEQKHRSHVYFGTWKLDYDYFRLDGSTPSEARQQMCDRINKASNERARLMLISTKAGGLGINLVGANRVVIFDASWNPTADSQAIFRVFRFGQVKPCYIYRLIAQGCMEEKIYDRQISKLSLACRVVDEQQVERHFNAHDVEELYEFEPDRKRATGLVVPKDDTLLMELVSEQPLWVSSVHGHDSLLQNVEEEELNDDEQRAAWEEYENDRRGVPNVGDLIPLVDGKTIDKATVIQMIKKDNPNASENEVLLMIPRAIQTLRAYYFKKQQEERRQQEQQYVRMLQQQRAQNMQDQFGFQGRGGPMADPYGGGTYGQIMREMAAWQLQQQQTSAAARRDDTAASHLHTQLLKRAVQAQRQQQQRQAQSGAGGSRPQEMPTMGPRRRMAHGTPQPVAKPAAARTAQQLPRADVQLPSGLQVLSVQSLAGKSSKDGKNDKNDKNEKKPGGPPAVVDIT